MVENYNYLESIVIYRLNKLIHCRITFVRTKYSLPKIEISTNLNEMMLRYVSGRIQLNIRKPNTGSSAKSETHKK